MSTDLIFSQPRLTGSPTALVFGGEVPSAPVTITASVAVLLAGSVTVEAAAAYDNRVKPIRESRVAARHQSATAQVRNLGSRWEVSLQQREAVRLPWQTARLGVKVLDAAFSTSLPGRKEASARWDTARPAERAAGVRHQSALGTVKNPQHRWQAAVQLFRQAALPLQAALAHERLLDAAWLQAERQARNFTGRSGASARYTGIESMALGWQVAGQARNGLSVLPVVSIPGGVIYPRDTHLVFECPRIEGSPVHLVFGARACYLPPINSGAVVVPIRKTYVTINSIVLRRVDGDVAIPTYAFSMSLDVDSWTWSWSAALPASALDLIQPGSSGEPVEVEALVNGVPYRLCAESVASQRQFAQARISVKGRGKAALLDAPYAPTLNFGNTAPRTAQQLMTDVLTVNGVGIGWAVDWQLTDWLVPGSTWTAQGSYIVAVNQIAQAAGGYVQPHATEQSLRVLPRYPAASWAWGDVAPDFELPAAVVAVEGIDWTRKAVYDRVFVSGTKNGVLGQVTRAGTAGASVAPMVTDALITHADAARQRGLAVLSDTGNQAWVTLTLPVLSETGLIQPGQFVRYLDGGQSRLGLVRSTSLAWSAPKLRQTLALETHV